MNEQNKYLEKFYKRNMSIDEIKNTYSETKTDTENKGIESSKDKIYYITFREKIFLWLFLCGILYKLHNFLF
jgi:hypothetical protein